MSEWFWKKLDQFFNLAAIAGIFIVIILETNIEIKDFDLWLHLGAGRYIVNHFSIPRFDVFSATVAGTPWLNHEWLFQIIVYWAHQLSGFDGISLLQTGLVTITFLSLLFWGFQSEKRTGMIIFLWFVFLNFRIRLTHRPDLFSLLFFVLYIQLLSFGLKNKKTILAIAFLQVIWVNIHGFFILGPLLIALCLLSEGIKRFIKLPLEWNRVGRIDDQGFKNLFGLFIVSLAACFVNPYLWKGALYPFKIIFSAQQDAGIFFAHIVELAKPILWSNIFSLSVNPYFKLVLLISLLSFFFNIRKLDVGALLLWLVFLVLALKAIRNVPYFAIASFFVFVANYQYFELERIFQDWVIRRRLLNLSSIGIKIFLCFWMVNYFSSQSLAGYFDFDAHERKSEYGGVSQRNYPAKAVDFLVKNGVKGNFLNDFNSGAYLIGRTFPEIKVFIDGRTELYGPEFFKKYKRIIKGDYAAIDTAIDEYNLTGAFLNSIRVPVKRNLIRKFYRDENWKMVYFDYDGVVFLKDIPMNKELIGAFEVDFKKWPVSKTEIAKVQLTNTSPFRELRRGYNLFNLEFFEKAKVEAIEALKISPYEAKAWHLLGKISLEEGDFEEAFWYLRKAKMCDNSDMGIRYNAGLALVQLNEIEAAEKQCRILFSKNPNNPKGHFLLARINIRKRNYEEALDSLKTALKNNPLDVESLIRVAEDFEAVGQMDYAKESYRLGLSPSIDRKMIQTKINRLETENN